ncbi:MAG: signal recognition particle protein [Planctomycetes bacterium]|nr:signal recognition particle protein [Planctomycetota bacterium]
MFESLTQSLSKAFRAITKNDRLTEANVEEGLRLVRQALLEADVNFSVARQLCQTVRDRSIGEKVLESVTPAQQFIGIFNQELTKLLGAQTATLGFASNPPTVWLMAGLQGSGKTTTCAKLAMWARKQGKKPLLAALDIQRPAAIEQLITLGKQLEIPVYHETGGRPSGIGERAVKEAEKKFYDVVILDTAGRLHVDEALMLEVAEVQARTKPHAVILVVDAMTGQDAVNSAKAFDSRLAITGTILTKLDGDSRGGAALSIVHVTNKPILFVGLGEKPADLEPFHPDRMASRILGMGDVVSLVEQAQKAFTEDEVEETAERFMSGKFDLNDLYQNLQRMKKMGPMKKVLGMLPGIGQMSEVMDNVDESKMGRTEAVYLSMTAWERRNPDSIDLSRKQRIARGSGNSLSQVNELLKGFDQMRKQMKQLSKVMQMSPKERNRFMKEAQRGAVQQQRGLSGGGGGRGGFSR